MRVGLIGLGNLGTATANLIAGNGHEVRGWDHDAAVVREIADQGTNSRFLDGVAVRPEVTATGDLPSVVRSSEVLFVAIPSVFIEPTLRPVRDEVPPDCLIVNMAKGIDRETGRTAFHRIGRLLPEQRRVMLSGPSIANEFARGTPTVVVVASEQRDGLLTVSRVLDNDHFRTRFSDDPVGVELGGIMKNIYAIGLGMFDGRGITSINFRAVYLTLALEEMARYGVEVGARIETFLYLSGLGDLLATSLSEHSHNRRMGELLAQGKDLDEIREIMGVLSEGYNALHVILHIAEKMHVSMPLARGLLDVVNGNYDAEEFMRLFIKDFVDHDAG